MTSKELIKRDGIELPAPGVVFVKLLKKNKTVPCLVIRVGPKNSTVEIEGVEAKVPNEDVDIDDLPEDE